MPNLNPIKGDDYTITKKPLPSAHMKKDDSVDQFVKAFALAFLSVLGACVLSVIVALTYLFITWLL